MNEKQAKSIRRKARQTFNKEFINKIIQKPLRYRFNLCLKILFKHVQK